jgi:large subunit ribosomal protein L21
MPILSPNRLEVPIVSSFREIRTKRSEQSASASHTRTEILEEESPFDPPEVEEFFSKINHEIATKANRKRLFAICHMYGTQYLFSEGDYIMLNKYFNIDIGTRIKVEKVMLVGGDNITLLGRPVLDRDLVNVEATVVEKTMSHTINRVHMVPRRANYRRWRFDRLPLTIIRINKIRICHPINEAPQDVHT